MGRRLQFLIVRGYVIAFSITMLIAALSATLRHLVQPAVPGHVSSPLFVIAVMLSGSFGLGPAMFSAALSMLMFEYFFLPHAVRIKVLT